MADEAVPSSGLSHQALFYRDQAEYLGHVLEFARAGQASGEPVYAAVPGPMVSMLRARLSGEPLQVSCGDMAELGRNPGRIIPAMRAFADAHAGRRVRYINEPLWPGRSVPEARETARHEALVNLAFSGTQVAMLCLYDAAGLAPQVLSDARCTHPVVTENGRTSAANGYAGPGALPPGADLPLTAPPSGAQSLAYETDLGSLRHMVSGHARRAGLPYERAADLVLAVSELAANTLRHTKDGGLFWIWHTEQEILCQVQDRGWITDPLAGRQRRPADQSGHGLWVVHQVCDLVELRTGPAGTTVRLHMRLGRT